ncbi:MAG TPA: hypothetical protein VFF73_03360, partial [Planctomycetota bacterium]|nr:hypothetical protein [Planctomycetota bacterium]
MTTACEETLELIAAQALGLLREEERPAVEEHLLACDACPDLARDLGRELETARFEPREPRPEVWPRIERMIQDERAGKGAATALRIRLACTFCHGALDRAEACYCAACLAPHHADCLETHGRCAAPGCGETRTVSPRERRRPRRRVLGLALVLLVGGGTIAALSWSLREAPLSSAEARALASEPGSAPPYPWGAPDDPIARKLTAQRITVNFSATPLSEIAPFLQDVTGIRFGLDPSVDAEQVKIYLRLRDVSGWSALETIARAASLAFTIEKDRVLLAPREKLEGRRAWPLELDIPRMFKGDSDEERIEERSIESKLVGRKLTLHFEETPLQDAIDTLSELTGLQFVVTSELGTTMGERRVSLAATEISVQDALASMAATKGSPSFEWSVKHGVIVLRPWSSAPAHVEDAASKVVALDLRGATVPELVQALQRQGIEVYASDAAWASLGTFSLVAHEGRLGDVLATLAVATPLRARIAPRGDGREVVLIEGRVASPRAAFTAPASGFAGVDAEVAELRSRLEGDVVRRRAARSRRSIAAAELHATERAAELTASQILSLLERAETVSRAQKRGDEIAVELRAADAAISSLTMELATQGPKADAARKRVETGIEERDAKHAVLEDSFRSARDRLSAERKELSERLDRARDGHEPQDTIDDLTKRRNLVEDDMIEASRKY